MKKYILITVTSLLFFKAMAQKIESDSTIPFRDITEYPETYTAGTIAARLIDALGFRFYWATEALQGEELDYQPGPDSRTIAETIEHVYYMSFMILNTVNIEGKADKSLSLVEKRNKALFNYQLVRDKLMNSKDEDFENYMINLGRSTMPFWNLINGMISDSIWHCGQIASYRRIAGNPFNSKVSVLSGKIRD